MKQAQYAVEVKVPVPTGLQRPEVKIGETRWTQVGEWADDRSAADVTYKHLLERGLHARLVRWGGQVVGDYQDAGRKALRQRLAGGEGTPEFLVVHPDDLAGVMARQDFVPALTHGGEPGEVGRLTGTAPFARRVVVSLDAPRKDKPACATERDQPKSVFMGSDEAKLAMSPLPMEKPVDPFQQAASAAARGIAIPPIAVGEPVTGFVRDTGGRIVVPSLADIQARVQSGADVPVTHEATDRKGDQLPPVPNDGKGTHLDTVVVSTAADGGHIVRVPGRQEPAPEIRADTKPQEKLLQPGDPGYLEQARAALTVKRDPQVGTRVSRQG